MQTFQACAKREAERYGQDDLVFLRELAQNARDAGAGRIEVATRVDAQGEWVVFDDDGSGMTFAHARAFLFRLYASSKNEDPDAAGCFGVGFWSVLRFSPRQIIVESRTTDEAWAVALDASLTQVQRVPGQKRDNGTRIALVRPARGQTAAALSQEIALGLRRYCRYLRQIGPDLTPLPIRCDGTVINEDFRLDGPSLAFRTRDAEGVVGFAEEPRVELYAHGLLVMTATVLDELLPGAAPRRERRQLKGLAPVVLINSNRLPLVMSRQHPVRNRVLRRLVRLARQRLAHLVDHVIAAACPRPGWERAADRLAALAALLPMRGIALGTGLVVVVAGLAQLASLAAREIRNPRPAAAAAQALAPPPGEWRVSVVGPESVPAPSPTGDLLPYANLSGYSGATVDVPTAGVAAWGLRYEGPPRVLFRALTLDHYDPDHGWLRGDPGHLVDYPSLTCRQACIRVELTVAAGGEPLVVPLPTGYDLERQSLELDGRRVEVVYQNRFGEAVIGLPPGSLGLMRYTTLPSRSKERPTATAPPVALPEWIEVELGQMARLMPAQRVQRVTRWVRDQIAYDVSPQTAAAFSSGQGNWLDRLFQVDAGDCDVKNGLNVLLLNKVGIPARMAVGIAGRDGNARPNLHAWTEYYLNGWRPIDATGVGAVRSSTEVADLPPRVRDPVAAPRAEVVAVAIPPGSPAAWVGLADEPEPDAARAQGGLVWSLVALLAVVAWLVRLRWRVWESLRWTPSSVKSQSIVARMLCDALAHPEQWRAARGLWWRRVLPTLAGRPLSVGEGLRRAADASLFVSRQQSELARLAASRGLPVLDLGHSLFAPVVAALGHGVDLDLFDRLRPAAAADPTSLRCEQILAPLNALVGRIAGVECRICPALNDTPMRDVDLSALGRRGHPRWPRRYIALNPSHEEVRRRMSLLARDPRRGVFVFVDWLLDRSPLLAWHAAKLRAAAARAVLAVRGGEGA